MSQVRKRYNPKEKARIIEMAEQGYSYKDIAAELRPAVKSAWRSIGDIVREHKSQSSPTEESGSQAQVAREGVLKRSSSPSKVSLPESMEGSLTAREFMSMLDDSQKEIFIATYEDLRGEADEEQLTAAENEMLMRASFTHVKYLRAQYMLTQCETFLMLDLDGSLGQSDDDKAKRRMAGRGDAYKKEAEQWHKEYMDLVEGLKLTRKQRLDKIKDTRNTFLDLQQELMAKVRQDSLVEEIKRINMATRDEFERMAKGEVGPDGNRHPWLIGAFSDIVQPIPKEENDEDGSLSDSEPI